MNPKENALKIIRFDNPERVVSSPPVYHLSYHGCNHESFENDLGHNQPVGTKWVDIWGTEWHKEHEGVMGMPKGNPIAEIDSLKSYEWPDPDDERICSKIYKVADWFNGEEALLGGSHRDTLWEKSYMLVGMQNMMIYFYTEPDYVREVLHRIMDFQLGIAEHYIKMGVEIVNFGDDLGTQRGPLINPKTVNDFLVPEYERLFKFYKEKGVLILFHSCGNIVPMLDMFMTLGVDILNPLQATANDLDEVRAKTQGKMTLQGGVSSATIMDGPAERIVSEVRQRMWQLGQEGGYFCSADQGMPFPEAHINALHEAINEYGYYPIKNPEMIAKEQ